MSLAIGAISQVSVGISAVKLSAPAATGGTAPYTYQWYKSSTSGFTPGAGNIIVGATALTLSDTNPIPGSIVFYKIVVTDAVPNTATSAQSTVTMASLSLTMNQYTMAPVLGMLDQAFDYATLSAQVDPGSSAMLTSGMAVKFTTTVSGVPCIDLSTLSSDKIAGFVNFAIKDRSFVANQSLDISMGGNVMWLMACADITCGQFLTSLPQAAGGSNGGVTPVTGSSGLPIVGMALDTVSVGSLVRVLINAPSLSYAID